MTFSSPLFILLLAVFTPVYYGVVRRIPFDLAALLPVAFSVGVYAVWGGGALVVLGLQAICNCFAAKRLADSQDSSPQLLLAVAVLLNVLLLAAYKYSGAILLFLASANGLQAVPAQPFLPPGLSFVTFIQIAMLVDVGTGRQAFVGVLNTLRFLFFFPYMISGPVTRYGEITSQFEAPGALTFSWDNVARALVLFSLGLFKKTVLADNLAPFADQGFLNAGSLEFFSAWISTLAYTLQLYFDFSGYSDMAIGAALLLNIRLPDNFLSPYKALNIQDFWRRWHVSLGTFMRDYMYFPLGGSRRGLARQCANLLAVFLLVGAWHGEGWTFVVWGALHGLGMAVHACWRATGWRLPRAVGWLLTFLFIHCCWVFFRAKDLSQAGSMFAAMAGRRGASLPSPLAWLTQLWPALPLYADGLLPGIPTPLLALVAVPLLLGSCLFFRNSVELAEGMRPGWVWSVFTATAAVLGLVSSGPEARFLYLQF